jgi:hypothetical protein
MGLNAVVGLGFMGFDGMGNYAAVLVLWDLMGWGIMRRFWFYGI